MTFCLNAFIVTFFLSLVSCDYPGYEPSLVEVEVGQKVRLNFLRRDHSSCLEKVLLPDFHIARDLTIDRVTSIEFTPTKSGEYPFTCGMNMYRGTIKTIASQNGEK